MSLAFSLPMWVSIMIMMVGSWLLANLVTCLRKEGLRAPPCNSRLLNLWLNNGLGLGIHHTEGVASLPPSNSIRSSLPILPSRRCLASESCNALVPPSFSRSSEWWIPSPVGTLAKFLLHADSRRRWLQSLDSPTFFLLSDSLKGWLRIASELEIFVEWFSTREFSLFLALGCRLGNSTMDWSSSPMLDLLEEENPVSHSSKLEGRWATMPCEALHWTIPFGVWDELWSRLWPLMGFPQFSLPSWSPTSLPGLLQN